MRRSLFLGVVCAAGVLLRAAAAAADDAATPYRDTFRRACDEPTRLGKPPLVDVARCEQLALEGARALRRTHAVIAAITLYREIVAFDDRRANVVFDDDAVLAKRSRPNSLVDAARELGDLYAAIGVFDLAADARAGAAEARLCEARGEGRGRRAARVRRRRGEARHAGGISAVRRPRRPRVAHGSRRERGEAVATASPRGHRGAGARVREGSGRGTVERARGRAHRAPVGGLRRRVRGGAADPLHREGGGLLRGARCAARADQGAAREACGARVPRAGPRETDRSRRRARRARVRGMAREELQGGALRHGRAGHRAQRGTTGPDAAAAVARECAGGGHEIGRNQAKESPDHPLSLFNSFRRRAPPPAPATPRGARVPLRAASSARSSRR